jgi:hypothetical protein
MTGKPQRSRLVAKISSFSPFWLEPRAWPNPGQLRDFRRHTTLTQREDDQLDTLACRSKFSIILRAASVTFLGVGPLRPELQSGLDILCVTRTMERARGALAT